MSKRLISGTDFIQMVLTASTALTSRVKEVNALNVFPVPDGDTGTNMNMTWGSGVDELKRRASDHLGKSAEALSKGLLMGARGNSGVILSQLFRGFAKSVSELPAADSQQIAAALQLGVDTAYKAVMRPVEGTILTVARETARHAAVSARRKPEIVEFMDDVASKAREALSRTPDMLPVLKQVGVVDAGGMGLLIVYEAFLESLAGEDGARPSIQPPTAPDAGIEYGADLAANRERETYPSAQTAAGGHQPVQAHLLPEDIVFGYCTEFMIRLTAIPGAPAAAQSFREAEFRSKLEPFGDSILVVSDDELVKVHLHTEDPGAVLSLAGTYGGLDRIKIDNMRLQHAGLLEHAEEAEHAQVAAYGSAADSAAPTPAPAAREAESEVSAPKYGIVAVAAGDGLKELFESLGAVALSGGQTMNPSTEEIVRAAEASGAETVFVLPNNSNIVMAARQAAGLLEDRRLVVIPTKTVPQGMAALVAFDTEASAEDNAAAMERAASVVRSGQVTQAVRDTELEGFSIREGAYIGIADAGMVAAEDDLIACCRKLVSALLADGREMLTVLTGEDAEETVTQQLLELIAEDHPDAEVEVHEGGQPLYPYWFAAE